MLSPVELGIIFIVNMIALGIFGSVAYFILARQINYTISSFMELFTGAVTEPNVKRAMSILGKESGKVRAQDAVVDKIAGQVLSSPQLAGLKLGAKALGIDVDGLIEEHGATEIMAGLTQLGSMLGIDVSQLMAQGITQGINTPQGTTPATGQYLKG